MSVEQNGPRENGAKGSRTGADGPGEGVRDGVGDEDRPVPKEAQDPEAMPEGTSAVVPPGAADGTDGPTKSTGPAEEQDSETPDSRGLTTDTSPGD